ncbi:hypothetical protein B0H14DRAFT_2613234 [Mycena olivaceomarginata]|nr:hypothetical protein B0H14DRAFT_2613234 [Mycena olivaceomarginata]
MASFYKDKNIILARAGSQRMGRQGGDESKSGVWWTAADRICRYNFVFHSGTYEANHNEMQRKRGGIGSPHTHYGTEGTKVEHYLDGASVCQCPLLYITSGRTLVDPRARVRWVFNAKGVHVENQSAPREFNTVAHSNQAPRATGILVTPIITWSVVTV